MKLANDLAALGIHLRGGLVDCALVSFESGVFRRMCAPPADCCTPEGAFYVSMLPTTMANNDPKACRHEHKFAASIEFKRCYPDDWELTDSGELLIYGEESDAAAAVLADIAEAGICILNRLSCKPRTSLPPGVTMSELDGFMVTKMTVECRNCLTIRWDVQWQGMAACCAPPT